MKIIVEGDSDKKFLESYLRHLNIRNCTKIVAIGGKDNIVNHIELKKEDFIIIFDADDDYNKSKLNIENQLDELDIQNYKKIAIHKEVL